MSTVINVNTAAPAEVGDIWYDPSKKGCNCAVMHKDGVKYYLNMKDAIKAWEKVNNRPWPKK